MDKTKKKFRKIIAYLPNLARSILIASILVQIAEAIAFHYLGRFKIVGSQKNDRNIYQDTMRALSF
jgi:hypothetical protein